MESVRKYILVCLLLLTGCTSTKQIVKAADWSRPAVNKATIRLTRESQAAGAACGLRVYDAKKEIGSLGVGGSLCWERPHGGVLIKVVNKLVSETQYSFYIPDTEAGKRYAYNLRFTGSGLWIEEVEAIP